MQDLLFDLLGRVCKGILIFKDFFYIKKIVFVWQPLKYLCLPFPAYQKYEVYWVMSVLINSGFK